MVPELDLVRVRRWAEQRVPPHARDQIRMELDVSDRAITILECRPPWREDFGPAPTAHIEALIDEIDRDPTGIFWG